jgi:hypothetical protein
VVRPWRDELLLIVLARADIHVDVYVGCEEGIISLDGCTDLDRGRHGALRELSLVRGIIVCRAKWLLLLRIFLLLFLEELT